MKHETRSIKLDSAELRVARAEDGTPTGLTGLAAVFNSETELFPGLCERIAPGAFSSSLKRPDDVRVLFNHDRNMVLGRTKAGTAELAQDDDGLQFSVDLPNTQTGRDVAESIERGDVDGCSFAFTVKADSWEQRDDGTELRTIEDVVLFDVGPVTFPAYADTTVAVRSRDQWREDTAPEPQPMNLIQCRQKLAEME